MKRLHFGLTDAERRQMHQDKSARRCFVLLAACIVIVGVIEKFL